MLYLFIEADLLFFWIIVMCAFLVVRICGDCSNICTVNIFIHLRKFRMQLYKAVMKIHPLFRYVSIVMHLTLWSLNQSFLSGLPYLMCVCVCV